MLRFRKSMEVAVAALDVLARSYHTEHPSLTAGQIAEAGRVNQPCLAKQLTRLTKLGFVTGWRGRGGGYRLAKPPEEILFADLMAAYGHERGDVYCLQGKGICDCPIRSRLQGLFDDLMDVMKKTSVMDHCRANGYVPPAAQAGRRSPRRRQSATKKR